MNTNPIPAHQRPAQIEELLVDVTRILVELVDLAPLVSALPTTHRSGLEFIPTATRQLMGRQHVQERRELLEAEASGRAIGFGASKAPGHIESWSLLVDLETTIRHLIRFTLAREPDIAPTAGRRERETLAEVIWRMAAIARQITRRPVAAAVLRDLEHTHETVRRVLFGEDRVDLGTCPHCKRPTLVAYLQTGVIRCERPRDDAGATPRCICDPKQPASQLAGASALCPCHSDPRFNHFWFRDRKRTSEKSWHALEDALKHPTMHAKETHR